MSLQTTDSMQVAHITGVNQVELMPQPLPVCGADDVILDVQQCGICGSDIGYASMGGLLGPGQPMALGHELVGTVSEIGSNVSHVSVGDRVVMNPEANENRIGNMAPEGGFGPRLLVKGAALDTDAVQKIPASMPDDVAALVEPLSVGMHAVHQGEVTQQDKVVIFGAGTIGLCALMTLKHYGVNDVVVVDLSAQRLAKAAELGAITCNPNDGDLNEQLRKQHGEASYFGMPIPASNVYIEATGATAVFDQAVSFAQLGSRIVVVGVHKAPVQLDLISVLAKELRITGSMAYPTEFPQVIEMLSKTDIDPTKIITHHFNLSDFVEAFSTAQDADSAIKVMVNCQL